MSSTLILANGKPPTKRLLTKLRASADWFICADGGANTAARYGCTPDLIVGDLDSISTGTRTRFHTVATKKMKDQNSTDLEKALNEAIRKKCQEIVVLGATGGRLDHAIGNLSALAKFSPHSHITFIDENGTFTTIHRSMTLSLPIGTIISLLPLTRCSGIETRGLRWNLKNEFLELGVREGHSNIIVSSPAKIKLKRGTLIVFIKTDNRFLLHEA